MSLNSLLVPHKYLCDELRTTSAVPKIMIDWEGRRSIMMLNVNQMLAKANHEKINKKTLY